jgi:hypothetical protein
MTTTVYFNKAKSLADELSAVGKKIEDEKMVSYILSGLDFN